MQDNMLRFGMTTKSVSEDPEPSGDAEFRAIFEQSALGMGKVRFADARWINVNNALCRMLGRTRDEMLSTPWPDMTHPDDVNRGLTLFRQMANGELDSYTNEKRFLHKQGHPVWARLTLSLVRGCDGIPDYEIAIIEDISDRKAAEQALADSRQQLEAERVRLQAIVDTIPAGLIMLDEKGAFVIENAEWKRTWAGNGIVDGVIDYNRYKGFRPDTGERIAAEEWPCALSLKKGIRTRDVILDIERFNGTRGTIVVSSAPIHDATGRVVAAVAANMDITELRITEAKLQEADRRKDEFLAMLAHELRNPLAPISSAAEMLQMAKLNEEGVRQTSQIIGRQVKHMTSLVDDLLDVSRVTRGLVELDSAPLNISHIVADAIEQVSPLIRARRHQLAIQLTPDAALVQGDKKRLVQVLANILNNAAKYTREGGNIQLKIELDSSHVFIEVSDNGVGMAPELVQRVFDLFAPAERSSDRSAGGLGLGLALVKSLVELHHGTVTCESAGINRGSTFTVCLPRLFIQDEHGKRKDSVDKERKGVQPLRIMVVDDNVDAASMLAMLLETSDYEVVVEHDARSALERAKVNPPQVFLLDIGLPEMDGNELAQRLRAQPETAHSVLIAGTGYGQDCDRRRSLAAGFDHHFVKPVDFAQLAAILAELPRI